MRKMLEWTTVLLIGGAGYSLLEVLWRGYTHWSMTVLGAICFGVLYALHIYGTNMPFWHRCAWGAVAITAGEFAVGCVVNLYFGWEVWDYSDVPLNILGQICPVYSLLWFGIGAAAAPLCRRLSRMLIFDKNRHIPCTGPESVL